MDGTGGRHVCCACTCSEVLQKGACRVQVLFRRDAKQAAEPRKGMPCHAPANGRGYSRSTRAKPGRSSRTAIWWMPHEIARSFLSAFRATTKGTTGSVAIWMVESDCAHSTPAQCVCGKRCTATPGQDSIHGRRGSRVSGRARGGVKGAAASRRAALTLPPSCRRIAQSWGAAASSSV